MKRTLNGFSINMGAWYYEGQVVNIFDHLHGTLNNVLITDVQDDLEHIIVYSQDGRHIRVNLSEVSSVTPVERRRVSNY